MLPLFLVTADKILELAYLLCCYAQETNFVSNSDLSKLTQVYVERGSSINSEDLLKEFLSSSYFYLQTKPGGTLVSFIHKTLKEYLLAEFYLETLLENKVYKLNVGTK
jgi:hypothetical protein